MRGKLYCPVTCPKLAPPQQFVFGGLNCTRLNSIEKLRPELQTEAIIVPELGVFEESRNRSFYAIRSKIRFSSRIVAVVVNVGLPAVNTEVLNQWASLWSSEPVVIVSAPILVGREQPELGMPALLKCARAASNNDGKAVLESDDGVHTPTADELCLQRG